MIGTTTVDLGKLTRGHLNPCYCLYLSSAQSKAFFFYKFVILNFSINKFVIKIYFFNS